MKSLVHYIDEKLIINKGTKSYKIKPTSFNEIRQIIAKRSDEDPVHVDLSDIDVSEVKYFVDLSGFNIFGYCTTDLEYLNVTGWDVSHIKNMFQLFGYFKNLKEIKGIENWKISKDCDTTEMFLKVPEEAIPDWYKNM